MRAGFFLEGYEDADAAAATLADAGASGIQIAWAGLDGWLADPARAARDRDVFAAAGLPVLALGGYRNLISADEDRRRANLDHVARCLRFGADLGIPVVSTETGTCNPDSDWQPHPNDQTPEAWDRLLAGVEELAEVAARSGAALALEGYVNNILGTVAGARDILARFAGAPVGLVADPYNYVSKALLPDQGEVLADFLALGDRFLVAHLKDVHAEGAERETPEFGLGVFDQAPYLAYLATRPDLVPILEHLPIAHAPAALARVSAIAASF